MIESVGLPESDARGRGCGSIAVAPSAIRKIWASIVHACATGDGSNLFASESPRLKTKYQPAKGIREIRANQPLCPRSCERRTAAGSASKRQRRYNPAMMPSHGLPRWYFRTSPSRRLGIHHKKNLPPVMRRFKICDSLILS